MNSKSIGFIIFSLTIPFFGYSQSLMSDDSIHDKIKKHFESITPELSRYGGLTTYGESLANFETSQIKEERDLFDLFSQSNLKTHPTQSEIFLCHNLLIHSSDLGEKMLESLNRPTDDKIISAGLTIEILFSGQFGENLALENLKSTNKNWQTKWAEYLSSNAIYESSIYRIEEMIEHTTDLELKKNMIDALMYIGSPSAIDYIKKIIDRNSNDEILAKCIFALAELNGYDGISYLNDIKTLGKQSKEEKKSSIEWLKKETSPKNKYGTEIDSDFGFVERFGDIKSPVMSWLEGEGLLKENKVKNSVRLTREKKDHLIELLIQAKCFGLEAVKGTLFKSIEKSDLTSLLKMRSVCYYSPNSFTLGRVKTIGIMIRWLRKQS